MWLNLQGKRSQLKSDAVPTVFEFNRPEKKQRQSNAVLKTDIARQRERESAAAEQLRIATNAAQGLNIAAPSSSTQASTSSLPDVIEEGKFTCQ